MNPTMATARNGTEYHMRRSTSIFHNMRHASEKLGGGSSVSVTSSLAPAARRSWAPLIGSLILRPRITSTTVGTAKTKNGTRQLNAAASTPASSGPRKLPSTLAARWNENTAGRLSTA